MGDLAVDAVRTVSNGIIGDADRAVGGDPANMPGYDFNPNQLAV